MARKVKQYLSKLSLETNEDSLQTLSLQCEPSINTCEFATETVKSKTFRFASVHISFRRSTYKMV